jgi:hypothetical protein
MDLTANFIVISKKTRTTRSFTRREEVDKFMEGRRPSDWAIYQLIQPTVDVP